jgi:glycosyltransferase involved in cell wall biosynthesis
MPIIAAASGETKKIVENADCGYCCAIGDEKALAEAILNAKNDLELEQKGARARQYSEKHFDKKTLMDEMDTYFN